MREALYSFTPASVMYSAPSSGHLRIQSPQKMQSVVVTSMARSFFPSRTVNIDLMPIGQAS